MSSATNNQELAQLLATNNQLLAQMVATQERTNKLLERIGLMLKEQFNAEIKTTPDGLPICPKHGEVMKKREKQGDTWYSHRVTDPDTGEELYCRGYACKSGPGFNVDTTLADAFVSAGRRRAEVR